MEADRTGFKTQDEPHPSELVEEKGLNGEVSIRELRAAIPAYCFKPSIVLSSFYLGRDLTYSAILIAALFYLLNTKLVEESTALYYLVVNLYGILQGVVWTGIWVLGHECGHGNFSTSGVVNDSVGFVLHSSLLAPYFSWKSTHRRHHTYANHMEKDLNYVPPTRIEYAAKLGRALDAIGDVGQDAPIVLTLRIILQQCIGWNWYIISNITAAPASVVKPGMSSWRYSHFDVYGGLFREKERLAVFLSDVGCLATIGVLYYLYNWLGSFETLFWLYVIPWSWCNHWIVMITYLHHTDPKLPKYTAESWTFVRGATATMDRNFGFLGEHIMHNISSDHVTHHLFSTIPHYYCRTASKAIIPLLGNHYHGRGEFQYKDLKTSFRDCQWVEGNEGKDELLFAGRTDEDGTPDRNRALWYCAGVSPRPEFKMRSVSVESQKSNKMDQEKVSTVGQRCCTPKSGHRL